MTDTFTLGGRLFKLTANSTIEHDYLTMDCIRAAGLDVLQMGADQHPEDFVRELLHQVHKSGQLFPLLAHLILPAEVAGKDWTPAVALTTAAFIKQLTSDADKQTVRDQVVAMLISFFQNGLVSLRTFPSYSEK